MNQFRMRQLAVGIIVFMAGVALASSISPETIVSQLHEALTGITGIKLATVGNTVLIEGEVQSFTDMQTIARVSAALQTLQVGEQSFTVRNVTTLGDTAKTQAAHEIEKQIGDNEITVHFVGDSLMLEGIADNDFRADRAVEIANANLRTVPVAPKDRGVASDEKCDAKTGCHRVESNPSHWTLVDMLRVKPPVKPKHLARD